MKQGNLKLGVVLGCLLAVLFLSISLGGATTNVTDDVQQTIFKVDNMTCGGCLNTINTELQQYDGMVELGADLRLGLVAVRHTNELSVQDIADAITEVGYPAREISDQEMEELRSAYAARNAGRSGCGGGCCNYPPSQE